MSQFWETPQSARTVPMRPLVKGMWRSVSPQLIPDFGCVTLKNYLVDIEGWRRRSGYERFAGAVQVPSIPQDMGLVWHTDGNQSLLLMTDGLLYRVESSGYTEINDTYSTGTADVSESSVTVAAADFSTQWILPNDIFRVVSATEILAESEIVSVNSETSLTLADSIGEYTGASYQILRVFNRVLPNLTDYVVARGEMVFADGRRPLRAYNPTDGSFGPFMTDPAGLINEGDYFIPSCVAFFKERLWVGWTDDPTDQVQRQRIRWSNPLNLRDFSDPLAYVDLPYSQTGIVRLLPMGNMLIAYFGDAIYFGILTAYPGAPVRFEDAQSGGIGLVGRKAVCQGLGAHFFVGQDNFYSLTPNGLEPIGNAIARDALRECRYPERSYAVFDPANYRIVFGIPGSSERIEALWSYDYRTREWSMTPSSTWMIANPAVFSIIAIDDLTQYIGQYEYDDAPAGEILHPNLDDVYPSIDAIGALTRAKSLYLEQGMAIWNQSDNATSDFGTDAVIGEIETKDYDFEMPDDIKIWLRLALKIKYNPEIISPLRFVVSGSVNAGRTWKALGTITIAPGMVEGYVNFRMKGSMLRVKILASGETPPYVISEMTMRARMTGREGSLDTQR